MNYKLIKKSKFGIIGFEPINNHTKNEYLT